MIGFMANGTGQSSSASATSLGDHYIITNRAFKIGFEEHHVK